MLHVTESSLCSLPNLHSASIAIRALLDLYVTAFGRSHEKTKGLLVRVLVFSVTHNNHIVKLYGHYAVERTNSKSADGDEAIGDFEYSRYDSAMFSLDMFEGRDRFKAYNFVRNVYDKFTPQHLERIRDAVRGMQLPQYRTGLSFGASDMTLEDGQSQQDSEAITVQDNDGFRTRNEPASSSQRREMIKLKSQLDQVLQQLREQRKEGREKEQNMESQMDQQRKESKEKEQKLERLMEQQRKESKEIEEKMDKQPNQLMDMLPSAQISKSRT